MTIGWRVALAAIATVAVMDGASAKPWRVFSLTSEGITGGIDISPTALRFENGEQLRLSYLGKSSGVSLAPDDPVAGIYRVLDRKDPVLLHGNKFCGSANPAYITLAEVHDGGNFLVVTVIVGDQEPGPGLDQNRICASYTYER